MPKKKKVALWMDTEQVKKLKAISDRTGIPQAVIIRQGVDWALKRYSKKS